MDHLDIVFQAIATPVRNLVNPHYWINVFFLASTFLVAAASFLAGYRGSRRRLWRRLIRYVFPRKVLAHPSALLDYRYYFVHGAVRALLYTFVVVASEVWGATMIFALTAAFGPGHAGETASWAVTAGLTVGFVVAYDFAYWWAHWLMHEVPVLWEFHKTHHSAEVLNPFTSMRAHPVDDFLTFNLTSMSTGATYGAAVYFFGHGAHDLTLMQMNVIMLIYHMTVFHLRHSHVWLPFSGWIAYVVQSPAHHQIHHSTDPAHTGKNLGFCLALWDWLFGTLYVPGKRERLIFGIGEESRTFSSVARLYLLPFANIGRRLAEREPPRTQADPAA